MPASAWIADVSVLTLCRATYFLYEIRARGLGGGNNISSLV